ncbi:RES domain-containing protein [Rahnella inusitata]|uniref:RES domain-containing protein n=1 Tax=Rahnella TaxID=34037 RepID=UPI0039B0DA08
MDDEKVICHQCIEEEYVKNHIKEKGNAETKCSYCNKFRKNVALRDIAEMMHSVFENHYERYMYNYDYGISTGSTSQEIIAEELGVDEEVADDINLILCDENNEYDNEIYNDDYEYRKREHTSGGLDYSWQKVKDSLKKEARFFNTSVMDFLDSLFSDIDKYITEEKTSPITLLPSTSLLYRARTFENYGDVESALQHPERNFGPPPSELARSGRMNASGISVFYGATSAHIAIAEVRPPVGSYVVVAPFSLLRPLRIFNVSALNSLKTTTGSIFDSKTHIAQERTAFLKTFSRKLTLPVFGKNQDNEYLTTQVIAEYLSVSTQYNLDGISFKSTQVEEGKTTGDDDYNVVLFNKSSSVEYAKDSRRKYRVELYENVEDDIYMFHPSIRLIEDGKRNNDDHFMSFLTNDGPTLELMSDSMRFYKVKGVYYQTDETRIIQGASIASKEKDQHDF